MRLILTAIGLLVVAGCSSTPRPVAAPARTPIGDPPQRGDLIGADAAALATRFGVPRLRVREGDGTKLQFAGGTCLLDVYLYPSPGTNGAPRVTHVDTRNREGQTVAQAACIAMIERR